MDTLFDILVEDNAQTSVAVFGMSESGRRARRGAALGLVLQRQRRHGARRTARAPNFRIPAPMAPFRAVLRKYVREERRLSLEEAIRKFTSLPASVCGSPTAAY